MRRSGRGDGGGTGCEAGKREGAKGTSGRGKRVSSVVVLSTGAERTTGKLENGFSRMQM